MQMFISYLKLTMNFKLFNICPPFAVMPIFQTHYLNDKKTEKGIRYTPTSKAIVCFQSSTMQQKNFPCFYM